MLSLPIGLALRSEIPCPGDAAEKREGRRDDERHAHNSAAIPIDNIEYVPCEDCAEKTTA
ncbi:MAG: hypothetical protein C0429_01545 [Sphingopyxis sp.]|nr:hypothetical protein [Sphingopyxis sp.]